MDVPTGCRHRRGHASNRWQCGCHHSRTMPARRHRSVSQASSATDCRRWSPRCSGGSTRRSMRIGGPCAHSQVHKGSGTPQLIRSRGGGYPSPGDPPLTGCRRPLPAIGRPRQRPSLCVINYSEAWEPPDIAIRNQLYCRWGPPAAAVGATTDRPVSDAPSSGRISTSRRPVHLLVAWLLAARSTSRRLRNE